MDYINIKLFDVYTIIFKIIIVLKEKKMWFILWNSISIPIFIQLPKAIRIKKGWLLYLGGNSSECNFEKWEEIWEIILKKNGKAIEMYRLTLTLV